MINPSWVALIAIFFCLSSCLTESTDQQKDRLKGDSFLYNGIELPEQWPPRQIEPEEPKEMTVPYLADKPDIISIKIGRQLFIDDFLIAKTDLETVHHTPTYYHGNPVLESDKEWEKTGTGGLYAAPFSDGVWYDEQDNKYKMWYLTGAGDLHAHSDQAFYTGYAESADGKTWAKPLFNIYKQTNIVNTTARDAATVWLDKFEKNPEKRYKMFTVARYPRLRFWQYVLQYSADGIHWSDPVAQSGQIGDRSTAFYNPFREVWCLSIRDVAKVSDRSRMYLEHTDPKMAVSLAHRIQGHIRDQHVVFWFTTSDKEPRNPHYPDVTPGIYNFDAIAYESIMLGFYSIWQGPHNKICAELGIQKRNEVLLGYSRDGFHFSRPSYTPFMGVNDAQDDAWNWGNVQSVNGAPIIVGDSLYFYVSGRRLNKIMWDSHMSTGLATLRRDGFFSMEAGDREGSLTTEKLAFDGHYLFVNTDVKQGELAVEVLSEDGSPVKDFTRKDCVVLQNVNSTKQRISWNNQKDLAPLKGKNIRLKFYLTKGALYAFWISSWETGESRGYTAGGGPGLSQEGYDEPHN